MSGELNRIRSCGSAAKGEAGANPAQSYLYCKRGRRREYHWPVGLRRCAGGGNASQETRCRDTVLRSSEVERCGIFSLKKALPKAGEGLFVSKEAVWCWNCISRWGTSSCAAAIPPALVPPPLQPGQSGCCLPGRLCPQCGWIPLRGSRWRLNCWSSPPEPAGPAAPSGRTAGTTRT